MVKVSIAKPPDPHYRLALTMGSGTSAFLLSPLKVINVTIDQKSTRVQIRLKSSDMDVKTRRKLSSEML